MSPLDDNATQSALLEATIAFLEEHDEAKLRVKTICVNASLTSSVIYSRYGSREGLIDRAYIEIYRRACDGSLQHGREWASRISKDTPALAVWGDVLGRDSDRTAALRRRSLRLRVLAKTLTRPSIRQEVSTIHEKFMAELGVVFDGLVQKGQLGSRLTGSQWAAVFSSLWTSDLMLGHNVNEDIDNLLRVADGLVNSLSA